MKDLLYEVYLAAGAPSLNEIAADISNAEADDRGVTGAPSRDTIRRIVSEPSLPPSQADTVTVAAVLARRAAWNEEHLVARSRALWIASQMATPAGRRLDEFDDRLLLEDLEIHQALNTDGATERLGALPTYVPRSFDSQLGEVAAVAVAEQSAIAVIVGGSSTGKTRACWEAVRKLPAGWRLWHPIDPSRPDAALAELPDIAPRTVLWLNEAQEYLLSGLGEQVAAGLRNLLGDSRRGPVLVLATLWPEHWNTLTTRSHPDRHSQVRELLDGHKIDVPDAFSAADLADLADMAGEDPRLREAAERAEDGQITQYLAGVPVLMDRYQAAPGVTKALIHAAMDARRLGAGPHIPLALLEAAAPGYLTDAAWMQTSDNWLHQALDYVTAPCNGIPGIFTLVKAEAPRNQRKRRREAPRRAPALNGPLYQLADYLDQHGRHHRADQIPPVDFWTATAAHAHAADLTALGNAAWGRGLYRDAGQLHKNAATYGSCQAATALVQHHHLLHPGDYCPARHATSHVVLDDPIDLGGLLRQMRDVEASEQVTALAERAAAHVALDDPFAVGFLLEVLQEVEAPEQVTVLAERAAAEVALDHELVGRLLESLWSVGAREQIAVVLARNPVGHVPLGSPRAIVELLDALRTVGAHEQAAELLAHAPAAQVALDNPIHVAGMLRSLWQSGAHGQVTVLAKQAAARLALDNPIHVAGLLEAFRTVGAHEQAAELVARDPAARVPIDDEFGVAYLRDELRAVGTAEADDQVATLSRRVDLAPVSAAEVVEATRVVIEVLRAHRASGDEEQLIELAGIGAAHMRLEAPSAVAEFLHALHEVGLDEQATHLAERAAAHVTLDYMPAVAQLLAALHEIGLDEQATHLAERLPAAGHFAHFVEMSNCQERFRFGREPDGTPASPWAWQDLE